MKPDVSISDLRRLAMRLPLPSRSTKKRVKLRIRGRDLYFSKMTFDAPQDAWVRGIDWVLFIYLGQAIESVSIVRTRGGAKQPEWHEITREYIAAQKQE